MAEIKDMIDNESLPGMTIEYKGEDSFIEDNFKDLGYLTLVAVTIVYLVLLFQFKSFIQPFIILVTVPLSVVGSAVGLYLTKQPMSFTTLLGIVSLFGVVVNNAIVLLDYINGEIKRGKSVRTAACEASGRRLRPIMLSTVTTVVGLLPLAVGRGELFKPMAVALMSGLMVSTLLTLIVIPVAASRLIKINK